MEQECPMKFAGSMSVREYLERFGAQLTPAQALALWRMKKEGKLW